MASAPLLCGGSHSNLTVVFDVSSYTLLTLNPVGVNGSINLIVSFNNESSLCMKKAT